jgi:hypothetical protein
MSGLRPDMIPFLTALETIKGTSLKSRAAVFRDTKDPQKQS